MVTCIGDDLETVPIRLINLQKLYIGKSRSFLKSIRVGCYYCPLFQRSLKEGTRDKRGDSGSTPNITGEKHFPAKFSNSCATVQIKTILCSFLLENCQPFIMRILVCSLLR